MNINDSVQALFLDFDKRYKQAFEQAPCQTNQQTRKRFALDEALKVFPLEVQQSFQDFRKHNPGDKSRDWSLQRRISSRVGKIIKEMKASERKHPRKAPRQQTPQPPIEQEPQQEEILTAKAKYIKICETQDLIAPDLQLMISLGIKSNTTLRLYRRELKAAGYTFELTQEGWYKITTRPAKAKQLDLFSNDHFTPAQESEIISIVLRILRRVFNEDSITYP